MAVALPYTAFITRGEVKQDALDSLALDEVTQKDAVHQAIIDYSELLEDSLHRLIMIRRHTVFIGAGEWCPLRGDASGRWFADIMNGYPVVEIVSPTTVSVHPGSLRKVLISSPVAVELDFFGGYRRADQDLMALQAEAGLSALSVLPPVLPGGLRGGCLELVLHRLSLAENKQFGTGRITQQVGGGDRATIASVDRMFLERVIQRLRGRYGRGL